MTFRYIGSKARLAEALSEAISASGAKGRFVDAFCGTGAVSEVAAELGREVWANDTMASAGVMTAARLTSVEEAQFERLGGYARAVARLNDEPGRSGFLHKTYSPASGRHDDDGISRRYFTEANAARLDAMRNVIGRWRMDGLIGTLEETLLLADLIAAANRCANIAGTYGCFLSKWQASALGAVRLQGRTLKRTASRVTTTTLDAAQLAVRADDLVYLDPPYTKRQYASYYHIIETIVVGDEPMVDGVSGLRPWQHKASDFCYKRKALDALVRLIESIGSRDVILSYSAEGHVDLPELEERLSVSGDVEVTPVADVGRYRPNRSASANGDTVTEYILTFARSDSGAAVASRDPAREPMAA